MFKGHNLSHKVELVQFSIFKEIEIVRLLIVNSLKLLKHQFLLKTSVGADFVRNR